MKFWIALLMVVGSASAQAQIDVYILAGQSNMVGAAPLDGRAAQNQGKVWMFEPAGSWDPLSDPIEDVDTLWETSVFGVGPGMTFADTMCTLSGGHQIGVILAAVSGSYMDAIVNDASGHPTNVPYWLPSLSTSSCYGIMMQAAFKAWKAGGTIKGFVWYQGESETTDRANVVFYDNLMHNLFQAVRQDLGMPNLPIVFVQLGPDPKRYPYTFWADIQAWQQAIADAGWPHIAMVSAANLHALPAGTTGQDIHLDTLSQRALGIELANAMFKLQNQ